MPLPVLMLGAVSFLTDVSSEMIFAVLPVFLVTVLGASPVTLGAMEGAADFAASSLDLASGYASDRTGHRKWLAVVGYGFSSLAKLSLLGAASVGQVVGFRVVERLGKSVRGPPRDALLAGVAPTAHRGLAFGVHKAFDKAGAVAGPLIAFALLKRSGQTADGFRLLFAVAVVPAFLAVATLALGIREVGRGGKARRAIGETLRTAGPPFRRYLGVAAFFSLGYASFSFLLLRASQLGFDAGEVALLYALYNAAFTVVSTPLGRWGDRVGRRVLVGGSYALYALTALGLALASSRVALVGLFLAHACFYAVDEGQTKAFIADLVPNEARATAIGIYGLLTAVAYFPASLVAGLLWRSSPAAAFGFSACVGAAGFVLFLAVGPRAPATASG